MAFSSLQISDPEQEVDDAAPSIAHHELSFADLVRDIEHARGVGWQLIRWRWSIDVHASSLDLLYTSLYPTLFAGTWQSHDPLPKRSIRRSFPGHDSRRSKRGLEYG